MRRTSGHGGFTLLGGLITYLDQTPGGHLIYDVRQRHISVIVFQERSFLGTCRLVIALRTDFPHQSNFSPRGQSGALLTPELAGINQATPRDS